MPVEAGDKISYAKEDVLGVRVQDVGICHATDGGFRPHMRKDAGPGSGKLVLQVELEIANAGRRLANGSFQLPTIDRKVVDVYEGASIQHALRSGHGRLLSVKVLWVQPECPGGTSRLVKISKVVCFAV